MHNTSVCLFLFPCSNGLELLKIIPNDIGGGYPSINLATLREIYWDAED